MPVIDAASRQLGGERVALELRMAPRARRATHVDHPLDAVARQEADEPLQRGRRVSNAERPHPSRVPRRRAQSKKTARDEVLSEARRAPWRASTRAAIDLAPMSSGATGRRG